MPTKEERRKQLFQDKALERNIKHQNWDNEYNELKKETPEEKTFRAYKNIFCWKYLLQVGFTRFFETEDWKHESPNDTFKRFDKKMWEISPNRIRKFTEESEQHFIDNPKEIWVKKEIINKYLPKGYQSIGELKENTVKAMIK